ncbi:MAG: hypothetical protein Tsb009_11940 [Planctomycetaceae bacterium]
MKGTFVLALVIGMSAASVTEAGDCKSSRATAYRVVYSQCGNYVYYYPVHRAAAKKSKDIVDTAVSAGSFKTLVAAVKAADLVETLKSKGPFTVFAPTDAAFSKLPKGTIATLLKPENKKKLQSILTYHVVPGKVTANKVVTLKSAKTVNGKSVKIEVKNGKVFIDGAQVVKTDIHCSNGVIHVIDSVILP